MHADHFPGCGPDPMDFAEALELLELLPRDWVLKRNGHIRTEQGECALEVLAAELGGHPEGHFRCDITRAILELKPNQIEGAAAKALMQAFDDVGGESLSRKAVMVALNPRPQWMPKLFHGFARAFREFSQD